MASLEKLDKKKIKSWQPWKKGPSDLIIKCKGPLILRFIYFIFKSWPFPRGRRPFIKTLKRLPLLSELIKFGRFQSITGYNITIDATTENFLFLSGIRPSEPLELAIMMRLVNEDDIFIDVGANIGLYILHILGKLSYDKGRYIALEPDGQNYQFLVQTFSDDRLSILNVAASNKIGEAYFERKNSLEAKISSISNAASKVQTIKIEDIIKTLQDRKLIIKIDVEGHEPEVLEGFPKFIDEHLPMLMLEYLPDHSIKNNRVRINDKLSKIYNPSKTKFYAISESLGGVKEFKLGENLSDHILNILVVPDRFSNRMNLIT